MNVFLNDKLKLSGEDWYSNEEEFTELISQLSKILECFHFHTDTQVYYSSLGMHNLLENFKKIDEMTDGVYSDNINVIRTLIDDIGSIDWTKNKIQKASVIYYHQLALGASVQSVNDTTLAEACEFKHSKKKVLIINLMYSEYNKTIPIYINRSDINPLENMTLVSISAFSLKQDIVENLIANRTRIYNHNPKHGENGIGKHNGDNISPLECSIADAKDLLKFAVTTTAKNELYAFDKIRNKYLVYKADAQSSYHGYHPIDQNEIPQKVKIFLSS